MDIEQLLKEGPSLTLNPEEEFSDLVVKEPQKEEAKEEDKLQIGLSFDSFVIERWLRDRDFLARFKARS